jgi:phosphoribosylformylglycinamidine synthase
MMRFAVLVFPGTWSDHDCHYALREVLGQEADLVWHREADLTRYDCIVLPGGFAHGDYLRCGAIARFSPVMAAVARHAEAGRPVIGICNGFQILCEAGLLPGALIRNESLQFRCQDVHLRVESVQTPFSSLYQQGQVLQVPISHGEGRYFAEEATLEELEANDQVVFRYCSPSGEVTDEANPNGSLRNIAGIVNRRRNVLGMMPHPERVCEPLMGGTDGVLLWRSVIEAGVTAVAG